MLQVEVQKVRKQWRVQGFSSLQIRSFAVFVLAHIRCRLWRHGKAEEAWNDSKVQITPFFATPFTLQLLSFLQHLLVISTITAYTLLYRVVLMLIA